MEEDDGRGFGLLNRFTSIPASPTYKVKGDIVPSAQQPLYGESKVLALCVTPGVVPEFPLGPVLTLITGFAIYFVIVKSKAKL